MNVILLPKLFWYTVRKNCSSDWEKRLKFEAEGQEFAKFLRWIEQFIQTEQWQVRTICGNRKLFQLGPGGVSYIINFKKLEFKLEKLLELRIMQEKL